MPGLFLEPQAINLVLCYPARVQKDSPLCSEDPVRVQKDSPLCFEDPVRVQKDSPLDLEECMDAEVV